MKRHPPASRTKEQTTPAAYTRLSTPDLANSFCSVPLRLKRARKVSYVPGELPREDPPDAPRLFIRGLGGSIKMDLSGVGTRLSPAAFAHYVPDDSLANIQIRQGDVVLIEPTCRAFRAGNLVLLEIDGRAVLRRLTKKNRVWYLNPTDNSDAMPAPLIDQPLQGVAVGIIRMFAPLKPVKYRVTDTSHEAGFSQFGEEVMATSKPRAATTKYSPSKKKDTRSSRSLIMLAAEKKGQFRLSEVEEKPGYKAWPNTR